MKFFFTLILICSLSFLNAQVFSENFDSGVPGSMTQTFINGSISWGPCGNNTNGAPCPINGEGSATFFNGTFNTYSTALETPVLDLSSGVFKVTFTQAKRSWAGDINELYVDISTDAGSTWTTMESYLEEVYDPTTFTITLSPFEPSATTKIRFRVVNQYGYRLILDDILINEVTTDDISLTELDIPSILPQGDVEIKGALKNEGYSTLTSFDINWQVDGGEIFTETYSSQSILPGQSLNFTHNDLWVATVGSHNLKVWISNTNVTDENNTNDSLIKSISIASGSAYKVPLYEKFSSSTCPPCFTFNTSYFNPFYENYAHDKATFISYQVNWPGAGDPYYTSDIAGRVNYYSISGAPTLLLNASDATLFSQPDLQSSLDATIANDNLAFFSLESDHSIDGDIVTVSIDVTPYLTGSFTVQAMVIELVTTENATTNGETEFHHVVMKALPDFNGTTLDFVYDVPQSLTLTADMSTTFVEEMDDLAVVVFIQDNSTKQIMQSGYTTSSGIALGLDEIKSTSPILFPNPSTGIVNIISEKDLNVQVFDLTGKNVFNKSNVTKNTSLNLSSIGKGIFLVNLIDNDGNKIVKKLILK